FQIFTLVDPLTLLYLARTNKALRGFLLDRQNSNIWRASLQAVESAPPLPPACMDDPAWCRLLFEEICHVCALFLLLSRVLMYPQVCFAQLEHDYHSDPIWWEFGARYCQGCSGSQ
ncbi:hypothetical protein FB45DRAFT_734141, partial [Roridomyces roridus]